MELKSNFSVVLDTNIYRNLTYNKSIENIKHQIKNLAKEELKRNIISYANPIVIWELCAHLADVNDPDYDSCKKSLIALYEHCSVKDKLRLRVLADPEAQLCNIYFKNEPQANLILTEELSQISKHIYFDDSESSLSSIRDRIKKLADELNRKEIQFTSDLEKYVLPFAFDELKDKAKRKEFLKFLQSPDSLTALAKLFVRKCSIISGSNESESEINNKADDVLNKFETPLKLYNNLLQSIIDSQGKINLVKRRNQLWDMYICFSIGTAHTVREKKLVVITEDMKDILRAAKAVNCEDSVMRLIDYLRLLSEGISKISKEDVLKVAELARLEFGEEELEKFTEQLGNILTNIEKLNELDTDGVEPTSHVLDVPTPLREDEVRDWFTREEALKNAPEQEDGFFVVPQVIED